MLFFKPPSTSEIASALGSSFCVTEECCTDLKTAEGAKECDVACCIGTAVDGVSPEVFWGAPYTCCNTLRTYIEQVYEYASAQDTASDKGVAALALMRVRTPTQTRVPALPLLRVKTPTQMRLQTPTRSGVEALPLMLMRLQTPTQTWVEALMRLKTPTLASAEKKATSQLEHRCGADAATCLRSHRWCLILCCQSR